MQKFFIFMSAYFSVGFLFHFVSLALTMPTIGARLEPFRARNLTQFDIFSIEMFIKSYFLVNFHQRDPLEIELGRRREGIDTKGNGWGRISIPLLDVPSVACFIFDVPLNPVVLFES